MKTNLNIIFITFYTIACFVLYPACVVSGLPCLTASLTSISDQMVPVAGFQVSSCVNQMVSRHISLTVLSSVCVTCVSESCDSNHEAASDPARSLSGFSSFTSQTIFGIAVSDTLIVMGRGGCQWSAWISILLSAVQAEPQSRDVRDRCESLISQWIAGWDVLLMGSRSSGLLLTWSLRSSYCCSFHITVIRKSLLRMENLLYFGSDWRCKWLGL